MASATECFGRGTVGQALLDELAARRQRRAPEEHRRDDEDEDQ